MSVLTKKLTFDKDVLDVISRMRWEAFGTLGCIDEQLERNLYERVNKALVAMGGKWVRGKRGHAFMTDPRQSVEGLLISGNLIVARDGFFPTPVALADRMAKMLDVESGYPKVLEPSAGTGNLIDAVFRVNPNAHIRFCEINYDRMYDLIAKYIQANCSPAADDFMTYNAPGPGSALPMMYDRIIMNPPFENGQDIDHVRHAFRMLKVNGGRLVAIMSEGPFFRSDSRSIGFRDWFSEVRGYSEKLGAGSFSESGTNVNSRLIVVTK